MNSSSTDAPDTDANDWIDANLVTRRGPRLGTSEAIELVESQPVPLQIAIFRACVKRLPELRQQWTDSRIYALGEQLYAIVCRLGDKQLPLAESDVCDILSESKHGCGHGGDVGMPVELANSYLSNNDVSSDVLLALSRYVDGLKGIGSIRAQTVKRRASILFLLDREDALGPKPKTLWSRQFTHDLADMHVEERKAWQNLVLSFKLHERSDLPNTWRKTAMGFIDHLEEERTISRLANWWPREDATCKLDTGASHLLKHFVWLMEAINIDSRFKPRCNELICALSTVHWKPKQPAAKVLCAAAVYLAKLPKDVAWKPLQMLCDKAATKERKIREVARQYASSHGLEAEDVE